MQEVAKIKRICSPQQLTSTKVKVTMWLYQTNEQVQDNISSSKILKTVEAEDGNTVTLFRVLQTPFGIQSSSYDAALLDVGCHEMVLTTGL